MEWGGFGAGVEGCGVEDGILEGWLKGGTGRG